MLSFRAVAFSLASVLTRRSIDVIHLQFLLWLLAKQYISQSAPEDVIFIPPRQKSWLLSSPRWHWVGKDPVRTLSLPQCIRLLQQCSPSTPHLRPVTSWLPRVSPCHLRLATSLPLDTLTHHLHHLLHHSLSCKLHRPHKATCNHPRRNRYNAFSLQELFSEQFFIVLKCTLFLTREIINNNIPIGYFVR